MKVMTVRNLPGRDQSVAVEKFSDEGYESGAPAGPELTLVEGQPIIVRFRGNISDADERPVKLTRSTSRNRYDLA